MRKHLSTIAILLLCAGLACLSQVPTGIFKSARAQTMLLTGAGLGAPKSASGTAPTITSYIQNAAAVSSVVVPSIAAGDVVVFMRGGYTYTSTGCGTYTINNVTLGNFTCYYDVALIGSIYWAYNSGSTLTNATVTTTEGSSRSFLVASFAGANTSTPFDSVGVGGPATSTMSGPLSLTIAHNGDQVMVVANVSALDTSPWNNLGWSAYGIETSNQPSTTAGTYSAAASYNSGTAGYMFAVRSP